MTVSKHIAVAGAGIFGLLAAYEAHRRGHAVTIFDPESFPPRASASYKAGGMLAPYAEIEHMDQHWLSMGIEAISQWADVCGDINAQDSFFQTGSLLIAHPDDDHMLRRFESHLPKADNWQNIRPQDCEAELPDKFKSGLYIKDEAFVYPQEIMHKLVDFLRAKDATFKQEKFTDRQSVDYDHVIDCRGAAAIESDHNLRGIKGELLYVRNPEFTLSRPVRLMHPRYPLYIVPRRDNIFMIGATNIEGNDHAVTLRSAMELMSALYALHPSFGEAEIIEMAAGIRPAYADNLPRILGDDRYVVCNGSYRHGYLLAPPIARAALDMIEGIENSHISMLRNR